MAKREVRSYGIRMVRMADDGGVRAMVMVGKNRNRVALITQAYTTETLAQRAAITAMRRMGR